MSLHDRLIHELIALDRRDSRRPGFNPYALPQMLAAADGVCDAETFAAAFNPTRGLHGIARRLGLELDVKRGRWVDGGTA